VLLHPRQTNHLKHSRDEDEDGEGGACEVYHLTGLELGVTDRLSAAQETNLNGVSLSRTNEPGQASRGRSRYWLRSPLRPPR
jgi:hypothetical protein